MLSLHSEELAGRFLVSELRAMPGNFVDGGPEQDGVPVTETRKVVWLSTRGSAGASVAHVAAPAP